MHDIIISYSIYKGIYETTKNNVGTLCLAEDPSILSTYISKPLSEGIASCIFRIPKKIIDAPNNEYNVESDESQHGAIRVKKAIQFNLLEYIEIKPVTSDIPYIKMLADNSNFHQ